MKKIIKIIRLKKGINKYFEQSITTDCETFINVKVDANEGGFEHEFSKTMTKEFFRKLKKINE